MKKYIVTFTHYGFVEVEAKSELDAFEATDVQEEEEN